MIGSKIIKGVFNMLYVKFPDEKEILKNKLILGADKISLEQDCFSVSISCSFCLTLVDTYKHTEKEMTVKDIINFRKTCLDEVFIANFTMRENKAVIFRLDCYSPLLNNVFHDNYLLSASKYVDDYYLIREDCFHDDDFSASNPCIDLYYGYDFVQAYNTSETNIIALSEDGRKLVLIEGNAELRMYKRNKLINKCQVKGKSSEDIRKLVKGYLIK